MGSSLTPSVKIPTSVKKQETNLEIQEKQQAKQLAARQMKLFQTQGKSRTLFDTVLGIDETLGV